MKPSNIGPPFSGQFKVVADMPRGFATKKKESNGTAMDTDTEENTKNMEEDKPLSPKKEEDKPSSPKKEEDESKANIKLDSNMELRRDVYDKTSSKAECKSCGKECGQERYKNDKGVYLCNDCHKDGKAPSDTSLEDFKQEKVAAPSKPWSDQENVLLMEGMEMYSDDWNKVADHVGSRTRDECILHYLQLPFEDPYVDTEIAKLGLLQYDPSRQTENPIMSVVAFLASTVKPEVAAAAVGQVPKERVKDDKEQQEQEEIKKKEEENKEARQLTHKLFRTKLQHFQAKVAQFEKLESIVEDERRKLEKERHQMTMDRLALKSKIEQVEREMLKRGNTPNSITPAQIQQQIAGGMMPGGSNMYMNPAAAAAAAAAAHAAGGQPNAQQPHPMQMQQQQYQLQMQRQMQQGPVSQAPGQYQQQQQQQQPPSSGHNFNMMSF